MPLEFPAGGFPRSVRRESRARSEESEGVPGENRSRGGDARSPRHSTERHARRVISGNNSWPRTISGESTRASGPFNYLDSFRRRHSEPQPSIKPNGESKSLGCDCSAGGRGRNRLWWTILLCARREMDSSRRIYGTGSVEGS